MTSLFGSLSCRTLKFPLVLLSSFTPIISLFAFDHPPTSPHQKLKACPCELKAFPAGHALICSHTRVWGDQTLGFGVLFHSIYNYFEFLTSYLQVMTEVWFSWSFISPFILFCTVYIFYFILFTRWSTGRWKGRQPLLIYSATFLNLLKKKTHTHNFPEV